VALLLWVQQHLIRRIAPEEYSLYPVLVSVAMILLISKSIFTGGIARYLSAARSVDDDDRIQSITSTTFAVNGVAAVALLIAGMWFSINIDRIITIDPAFVYDARVMMAILVASIALRLAFASFEMGLIVEQKFVLINGIELLSVLIRLVILLVLIFGVSTRVLWVAVATEFANALALAVKVVMSRRVLPALRFHPSLVNLKTAKELLSFGSWSLVGMIASRMRTTANPLILNQLAGPVDVSAYYIGSLVPKQIHATTAQANTVVLPSMTAMHSTGQTARLAHAYIRYGRIMSFAYLLVATPVVLLRQELVILYAGHEYLVAAAVVGLLLLADGFSQSYEILWQVASAKGRIRTLTLISVAIQSVNLLLTLVLVGVYDMGALGAAFSTLVTRVVLEFAMAATYGVWLVGTSFRRWLVDSVMRGITPFVLTYVLATFVQFFSVPTTWTGVFIHVVLYSAIYLATVFAVAKTEDRRDMRSMWHHVGRKLNFSQA